jgi:hypothetical protein
MEKMKIAALLLFVGAVRCDEDVKPTQSAYQDYVRYSQLNNDLMNSEGIAKAASFMKQIGDVSRNLGREASLCQEAGNCEQSLEFQRLLGEFAQARFGLKMVTKELENLSEIQEQDELLAKYKS